MSLSEKDGGLPPDDVVDDDEAILAASEDAVNRHHDRSWGAMTRIALAPCSPFSVTEDLMVRSAELAERLDVRLHTHFAENAEDDEFSVATFGCRPTEYLERTGWCSDRTWVAHCVRPDESEIARLGAARVGAAHCPSSNLILASGIAPVVDLRAAGVHVGLGVDGSSSADSASLWLEARHLLLALFFLLLLLPLLSFPVFLFPLLLHLSVVLQPVRTKGRPDIDRRTWRWQQWNKRSPRIP